MTIDEFALKYTDRLHVTRDQDAEIKAIVAEINGITYTSTGLPVDKDFKRRILARIRENLAAGKTVEHGGRVYIIKEAENKAYLALVAQMSALLGLG